jgi:hypothetical protein
MRPSVRALLICCLFTVLGGYFFAERQRKERRHEAWQRDWHVQEVLGQPVRIILPDANHCTLLDAVELLRGQLDVPLDIESRLEGAVVHPACLVSHQVTLQGVYDGTLDEVLEHMLMTVDVPEGVDYELEEGRVVIRRGADFEPPVLVRQYAVPAQPAGLVRLDERDIQHLISVSVDAYCWDEVGGPYTTSLSPGGVTVAAPSKVHRRIALMLRQLAQLPTEPQSLGPVAFLEAGFSQPPSPILLALDRVGDFNYEEVPLLQFLGSISQRFDIPILTDPNKLDEAGIGLNTPITCKMSEVSLRTFLRHALGDMNLTYTLQPRGMMVSSPEDASSELTTLLYPVQDLLGNAPARESRDLQDAITSSVHPDSWEDVGGPGSLQLISGGWLLVWQSDDAHEELLEFLNRLRHDVPRAGRRAPELTREEQETRRIQTLLCGPALLDLEPMLLDGFADALQKRLGVSVSLSRQGLANSDPRFINISLDRLPRPLWRQLAEALKEHDLSFVVEDGFLSITTEEDASNKLAMEVVNTRDLTVLGKGHASEQLLMLLIKHAVDPESWDDFGGPGSMFPFRDSLLIFHDRPSLFEIREFLSWLRDHRSELPTPDEIAALEKSSPEYRRLVAQSQSTSDHWRAAYLRCLLSPKLPEVEPNQPLVPPLPFGGGFF